MITRTSRPSDAPSGGHTVELQQPTTELQGWRQIQRQAYRDPLTLLADLDLDRHPIAARLDADGAGFPFRVPRPFVDRMRRGDANDPLLRQVLPLAAERQHRPGFVADPVGDRAALGGTGLIHKYAGRALLITTGACAVHCRYCFRREFPYASQTAGRNHWDDAVNYLKDRNDIHELILSGGDPLSLSTGKLRELTAVLTTLPALRRLRLHTRLPVVIPQRVTDDLTDWLSGLPWQRIVVLHINHAREIDSQVVAAVARLRASGAVVFNQAVLLAGINDRADDQIELSEALFAAGIIPYYLHLLDRVTGAGHFDPDRSESGFDPVALADAMRRGLPGYLVPRIVREQAGAPYKLPVL